MVEGVIIEIMTVDWNKGITIPDKLISKQEYRNINPKPFMVTKNIGTYIYGEIRWIEVKW